MIKLRSLLLIGISFFSSAFLFGQTTTITFDENSGMKDAMVGNGVLQNTNFGAEGQFNVSHNTVSETQVTFRSFIEFDLTALPTNAVIISASLKLTPKEVNDANDHPIYIERVNAENNWSEGSLNWTNQPEVVTIDKLAFTHAQTLATVEHAFDVKKQVQFMADHPALNHGWRIRLQNEQSSTPFGIQYHSKEATTVASRPVLEVSYILPVEITPKITHCTAGNNDGEITTLFSGGSTFRLKDIVIYKVEEDTTQRAKTTLVRLMEGTGHNFQYDPVTNVYSAENLEPGVYILRVLDGEFFKGRNYDATFYKHFLVGREGEVTKVLWQTRSYQDNVTIGYDKPSLASPLDRANTNYFTTPILRIADSPNVYEFATLMKYKTDFDPQLKFTKANLTLYANGSFYRHHNSSNAIKYSLVTSDWEAKKVTWNTRPGIDSSFNTVLPTTTTIGFEKTYKFDEVDLLPFVEYWQEDPANNKGIELSLETYGAIQYAQRSYRSNNHNTNFFRLEFEVKGPISTQFDEASNTGSLTVTAPDGNLPYTYLINSEPLGTISQIEKEFAQANIINGDLFLNPTINETEFTFNNLPSGEYFVAVYDNAGTKIFDGNGIVTGQIQFYNQNNLELSSNGEISLSRSASGLGNGRLFGELQEDAESGGVSLILREVGDLVIGFNKTSESIATAANEIDFGLSVDAATGTYTVIVDQQLSSINGPISNGANIEILKDADKYLIYINGTKIFNDIVPSMSGVSKSFDVVTGSFSAKLYVKNFKGKFKKSSLKIDVDYPECGELVGNIILTPGANASIISPPSLTNNHTGGMISATLISGNYSFPNVPIGSYTLNGSYTVTPVFGFPYSVLINEQLPVGFVVEWEDLYEENLVSSLSGIQTIKPNPGFTGVATANTTNKTKIDVLNWVQFDANISGVNPGIQVIYLRDDSEENWFGLGMSSIGSSASTFFGDPSDSFTMNGTAPNGVWRMDQDGTNFRLLESNNLVSAYSSPSVQSYDLSIFQMEDVRFTKIISSFCSNYPIPDQYVQPKREVEGGYFLVPNDDLLRFEFNEEYAKGNALVYKVRDYTGAILTGLDPLTEEFGDNRLSLDVSSLSNGVYIMEIFNDKGENWFIRFKVQ